MSELATTWQPSCHAALLWSTLTLRMSLSLMKETGWNDGSHVDGGVAAMAGEDCIAAAQTLHSTPHHQTLLSNGKRNIVVAHFSSLKLFYLIISLSRCDLSPSSVSLVFQEKFFAFIHLCTTTQTCFCWISCDEIPYVYYVYHEVLF